MALGTLLVLFLLLFLIKGRKWACNDLLQVLMLIKVTFDPRSQALKSPLLIVVLPEGAASVSAFIESKLLATVFACDYIVAFPVAAVAFELFVFSILL